MLVNAPAGNQADAEFADDESRSTALSHLYRCQIIQSSWNAGIIPLKNIVLSSFEMTETFACFIEETEVTIRSIGSDCIQVKFSNDGKYFARFIKIPGKEIFWMLPFIRRMKLADIPSTVILQKLASCNRLEKLDLVSLKSASFKLNVCEKLASIASHVSDVFMDFRLFSLGASKFHPMPKVDTLKIFFGKYPVLGGLQRGTNDANYRKEVKDCLVKVFKVQNTLNLNLDTILEMLSVQDFNSIFEIIDSGLNKTRSIFINFRTSTFGSPDSMPDLLSNLVHSAPNLVFIDLKFENLLVTDTEYWAERMIWYADTCKMLRERAPQHVKIVITYLSKTKGTPKPNDLQAISDADFNISEPSGDDMCYVTNRQKQLTSQIH